MFWLDQIDSPVRKIAFPVIGAMIVGYFAYHSVKGEHGLSAYLSLSVEVNRAEVVLADRRQTRKTLEHRASLLRPDNLDLDTLDERARAILNVVRPDERVVLD